VLGLHLTRRASTIPAVKAAIERGVPWRKAALGRRSPGVINWGPRDDCGEQGG
jgi:hypothetical protein